MVIDFVIPWVDGSDPQWIKEKNKYSPKTINENNITARFRDWGLLPYWFRGVEKFTPWVNKVYFVTWGHVPEFLNLKAPKLQIVNHKDYIPKEYLPTFSSHCIELNFHRIPGLSEHFVYFNDDMFMLRPFAETDFFKDGLPCSYGGEIPIEFCGNIGTWQHAVVNNMGIINAHFPKELSVAKFKNKYLSKDYYWKDNIRTWFLEKIYPYYFTGFQNIHAPAAYLKSVYNDVWNKEYEKLNATCKDRFRTSDNVNQWVFLWWQIASGQFSPRVIDNYVNSVSIDNVNVFSEVIAQAKHEFVCVNDPETDSDIELLQEKIESAFQKLLPDKSIFEK